MQGINEAIKLAIEKGEYEMEEGTGCPSAEYFQTGFHYRIPLQAHIVLDPLFWQSLGKALGWEEYSCGDCFNSQSWTFPESETDQCLHCLADRDRTEGKTWNIQAHRYLDAHFEGQEAEDKFWKGLLK